MFISLETSPVEFCQVLLRNSKFQNGHKGTLVVTIIAFIL